MTVQNLAIHNNLFQNSFETHIIYVDEAYDARSVSSAGNGDVDESF